MQFEQLGPYRLGKKLGQGGMGAVYAGVDQETGAAAAVKVLSPSLASEEGFRVRFEAEIESLKKLNHPHIVRLYGYGEQAGTLFYAMELVEGTSLEDELRAGRRFDWREVTTIAIKLCRALKHAHDHGVIHRDLKPANLLLTPDGDIKLSDFGIARLFGNTRLTSDGGVLGTAEYMAPEQAEGRAVTDRCDQYSLGGVLYALLAGRPPFRAKSLVEMLQLQRYAEPEPVTRFAPQTPAELTRIIHQLLEKDPQDRFANTLILSRSLEAMERGLSISLSRGDDFVLTNSDANDAGPETGRDAGQLSASPLPATMTPTQLAVAMGPSVVSPADVQVTEATMAYAPPMEKRSAEPEPPKTSDTSVGRFTKVENRRDDASGAWTEILHGLLAPQTLALLGGLLIVVLGGWYLMQPATADSLHRQIEAAAANGDVEILRAVRPKIEDFLARFPDDPRADSVRGMQDELKQTHPIQRAYVEAKRYVLIDPEVALAKFSALIDVYDDATDSDVTRHYVKLARQQRDRVQKQIDSYAPEGRKLVESRMARAAEVAAENPTLARRIYLGVIELYGEKPWAADLVAKAQAALNATAEPTASAR
jgi:eukaryotic-like serine/threonine-protein kinase